MEERQISKAVIKRLPRYYRYLGEMLNNGVERISSGELSTKMQVTASQIRQDLNNFGGFGQQGYGYNVKFLYDEIGNGLIKRIHQNYRVIVGFNMGLIILGVAGILQPTTSALFHNTSTLLISLKSMTDLLPEV